MVATLIPTLADPQGPSKGSREHASIPYPRGKPAACKNPDGMSQTRSGHGAQQPPYLFMQPQELAVAHPAVQHPVHVDVVGLQGKRPVRSQYLSHGEIPAPAQLGARRMTRRTQEKAILLRTLPRGRWSKPSRKYEHIQEMHPLDTSQAGAHTGTSQPKRTSPVAQDCCGGTSRDRGGTGSTHTCPKQGSPCGHSSCPAPGAAQGRSPRSPPGLRSLHNRGGQSECG